MCAICGCGVASTDGQLHPQQAEAPHPIGPHADHDADSDHEHVLSHGTVLRHKHPQLASPVQSRVLDVERALLADNDAQAQLNRRRFDRAKTLTLNLMSSPGAGKTTLLEATLRRLHGSLSVSVIEGDQQTSLDAERIRRAGAQAVQVNTGKACHLDAGMIDRALTELTLPPDGVLFIENVGNLVCPASFDLGEHQRIVIASVTEGEDKPLKYPDMFARADLVVVSKIDLLPHLDFDPQRFAEHVRRVQPRAKLLQVSARSGEGLAAWLDWLTAQVRALD
ncbi:MAG: hydrogenase nickel incorporation protein HypB [Polyangia bacterium]